MASNYYVYLSSQCSNQYFPDNTPAQFTSLLPKQLMFTGSWEVALLQFQYPSSTKKSAQVNIHTDIISDVLYEDNMLPVLRRLSITSKGKLVSVNVPFYIPVKKDHVDSISLHILNDKGQLHSFANQPVRCTLHFRKCHL